MERILQTFLKEQYDNGRIHFLDDSLNEIIYYLDDIKKEYLYKTNFHGLYHSQKVCFFAYLIGKHENLSDEDMQILMDAARYHDIGRVNDNEDNTHGYSSARIIDKIVKYDNPTNMYYLKSIMEAHAKPDDFDHKTYENWLFQKFDDDELLNRKTDKFTEERFTLLSNILKDADALDRLRFRNCPAVLDEKYLRVEYSKQLINLSRLINDYYLRVDAEEQYKIAKDKYGAKSYDKSLCFHSIGFDFFKALSILNSGVLSYYSASKNNINLSRNFNGNNSEFWISVVELNNEQGYNEGYERYVKNGVSFLCYADRLVPGVARDKDNGSFEPRSSEEYHDEKFVFDKIPVENIQFVSIPRSLMNTKITDLQYLFCNSRYETVYNNVHNYLDEIEAFCDIKINRTYFNRTLNDFKNVQMMYNNEGRHTDAEVKEYLNKLTHMKAQLNIYLQEWMQTGFAELLNKNFEDTITLSEVMKYILNRNGIEYDVVDNYDIDDDPLYLNFPFYKDKDLFLLRLSTFDLNKNASYDDFEDQSRS